MVKAARRLFICLHNAGYEVSLERLKIYVALPDAKAERTRFLRIVDESGEDYLYPSQRFVAEVSVSTRRAVCGRTHRVRQIRLERIWTRLAPRRARARMARLNPTLSAT
jgi:hypothetical protein